MYIRKSIDKVKVLDLGAPMMRAWPEDCFLSSLIQRENTAYDWIINSFVQICCYKEQKKDMRINFLPSGKHHYEVNLFDLCPFVSKYCIENEMIIENYEKFTDYIIQAISKGYYVSTYLEQFYGAKGKMTHEAHPVYIFGYNLDKNILYTADNYFNGKYGYLEVTLDEADREFYQINSYSDKWFEHRTYTYKLKSMQHNFDVKLLYNLLNDYLNSYYSTSYKAYEYDNMFYGIECYKAFISYVKNVVISKADYVDLKSLVFFQDYKLMMERRIEYLINNNYLLQSEIFFKDKMKEDFFQYNIILNLAIKYNMRQEVLYLDKIIERMNKLYQEEFVFIEKLMTALKSVNAEII